MTPPSRAGWLLAGLLGWLPVVASAEAPPGYELVWQDEFATLALGEEGAAWRDHFASWNVRYLDGNGDRGFKLSDETRDAQGVSVRDRLAATGRFGPSPDFLHEIVDDVLVMRTFPKPLDAKDSFDDLPYLASMISGEALHSQRLGYWEVRFRASRIPAGHHVALWLLPDRHVWPPEIDLLEIVASEPGRFFANSHGLDAPAITSHATDAWNDWHIIGWEWTEDAMIWRLDGEIIRQQAAAVPADIRFYFLASFEIGSRWPGPVTADANWPGRFEIDYVRIYQRRR